MNKEEKKLRKTLERLYLKDKFSLRRIATIFGCSHSTIQRLCDEYNIKMRGRGYSPTELIKKKNRR